MTREQHPADHATLFCNTLESKKKDITWKVAYQMNPIRRRVRLDSPPTAPYFPKSITQPASHLPDTMQD